MAVELHGQELIGAEIIAYEAIRAVPHARRSGRVDSWQTNQLATADT
jgi:hypothetical protein